MRLEERIYGGASPGASGGGGVQESPHYPAGLALRFARVKRYRMDKNAEDADTIETVRAIFARSR